MLGQSIDPNSRSTPRHTTREIGSMLSLEEARQNILELITPLPTPEQIALHVASERFLAESVSSPINLPPFDNSAMDGYALRSADVANSSAQNPVTLRLAGKIAAGDSNSAEVSSGMCVRVFTGSPLPQGADAVVMQEDTDAVGDEVAVKDAVKPWENIRFAGEDIKAGRILAEAGEKLSPGKIALLAATGRPSVRVGPQPRVGLLATGNELVEPGERLQAGQIYESNRAGLSTCIQRCGGRAIPYPLVPDTMEATTAALEKAFGECDCVVTSGGVSVGEFDFVKAAFEKLGGEINLWKVAIRPGKPFVFGQLRGKYLFGLPGNPVSALVTFFLLVRPALLRFQGAQDCSAPVHSGILTEPISNDGDRRHFIRVTVDHFGNVRGAGVQASHIMSSLASANGLIDVPPRITLPAGTSVLVMRWD